MKPRNVFYIVSQELIKVSSLLPSNKNRSLLVHSLANSLGLLEATSSEVAVNTDSSSLELDLEPHFRIVRPRCATVQELCMYHDRDYIDFILDPSSQEHKLSTHPDLQNGEQGPNLFSEFGVEDDCPPFRGLDKYVQLVAGGTLTATELLKSGDADIAIFWDGGRHHAQKSRASGFCYVADCILAILSLKKAPPLQRNLEIGRRKARVMYLDFDLHFSDAVSECFYNPISPIGNTSMNSSPQVLTLSVHHAAPGFYPVSALSPLSRPTSSDSPPTPSGGLDPFTLSIPLKQGASIKTFHRLWSTIESIKNAFNPDYVVLQCGTDGIAGDPHAIWNWSLGLEEGSMDWCVSQVLNKWGVHVLMLGGGGYNSANTARAWATLTSIARKKPVSSETQIPDHTAFPLYAPSFIMEVPAGNMRDENTDEYLQEIEQVYSIIVEELQKRCTPM